MKRKVYLDDLPWEEALEKYLTYLEGIGALQPGRPESITVEEALGRVTAAPVYARISSPHYHASAMDGMAVKSADTYGASETNPKHLNVGQEAVQVDTGDPLPTGCDAVIMIEDVHFVTPEVIEIIQAAHPWQHIRMVGEDVVATEMILPANQLIRPVDIGAALAGGVPNIFVHPKPKIAILPTGTELVQPGTELKPGDIIEYNSRLLGATVKQWGAIPMRREITIDNFKSLQEVVSAAADEADIVLINAGSSAGSEDFTSDVIGSLGKVLVHGVATRPGKPVILGEVHGKPVVGVPGYPVSGIIVLEELVKPVLDRLLKREREVAESVCVKMGRRYVSSLKYREFVRATLGFDAEGSLTAVPIQAGAGVITSLTKADCILDVPQNSEGYEAGERAHVRLLKPIDRIARTVRILGSHDPLIDEAADELRRADIRTYVSSAHVGSMGAILALSRGEGQLGGVHLLDETDGSYNTSYVERFIPDGGVALIECVRRAQGLIVAKGNPLGIQTVADLAKPGVRYANRQRGAGTRVLLDYLLRQEGVSPQEIAGYDREELTHTAVAAQITAGSADCGLGILSAARMYDLDFVPVCEETYDLLVSLSAMESPQVRAFLRVLGSESFLFRLDALGGYSYDKPGRIKKIWPEKQQES